MGIIDDIKAVASTVQQIDNIGLYKQILDLQNEAMGVVEENSQLKKENADLEAKLKLSESLEFRDGVFWRKASGGDDESPFCPNCWQSETKLISLNRRMVGSSEHWVCSVCSVQLEIPGGRHASPRIDSRRSFR